MDSRTPTPMLHAAAGIIVGLFMAVILGQAAAQGSYSKIGMILALGPFFFLVLGLQHRIWIIIPFFAAFSGSFPFLPLPFAARELAIMATFGVFVMLAVFKKLEKGAGFELLDLIFLLNIIYLGSVYMRNPVGFSALGTDQVGGRPYFAVAISCMLYFVYTHISLSPKLAYRVPLIGLGGGFIVLAIWFVSYKVPGAALVMSKFYSGVDFGTLLGQFRQGPEQEGGMVRLGPISDFGSNALMCLMAYYNPITLFSPMHFWRFTAFLSASVAMMMGGFRSKLLYHASYLLLAAWFKGGLLDVIRISLLGFCALLFLLGFQLSGAYPLPISIQRTLSALPLPLEWDSAATDDASASTEWRLEIWKDVMTGDKWIKDRFFGDGFGFKREELALMKGNMLGDQVADLGTDAQKIQGAFHNGPLSAIRFVGAVGLILYLVFICALSFRIIQLIRLTLGTPYQAMAFLLIPAILGPVYYVFVFGQYDSSFPSSIVSFAIYKLIFRSFNDHRAAQRLEQSAKDTSQVANEPEPSLITARSHPVR